MRALMRTVMIVLAALAQTVTALQTAPGIRRATVVLKPIGGRN
jgi:hypothetical protein